MSFSWDSILGLAVLLLVGLIIAVGAMTIYTIVLLTHPPRRTYASALARGRPGEPDDLDPGPRGKRPWKSWALRHNGLDLPIWDIEGDDPNGPVFILSHGWGDSRIGGLTRTPPLAQFASRIVLWDMPGHGEAKGTCSLGTREVSALQALIERIGEPVVLYGWSLGAGISIVAAAETSGVAAVIAEAPYCLPATPARNVLRSFGLPYRITLPLALWILGTRFDVGPRWRGFNRATHACELTQPLLVIHGELDTICPIGDGQLIARSAEDGTLVAILSAGHHSLWTDPAFAPQCEAAIRGFLTRALNSQDAQQPDS